MTEIKIPVGNANFAEILRQNCREVLCCGAAFYKKDAWFRRRDD